MCKSRFTNLFVNKERQLLDFWEESLLSEILLITNVQIYVARTSPLSRLWIKLIAFRVFWLAYKDKNGIM